MRASRVPRSRRSTPIFVSGFVNETRRDAPRRGRRARSTETGANPSDEIPKLTAWPSLQPLEPRARPVRADAGPAARSWIGAIGAELVVCQNTCATQGYLRRSRWSRHCGGGSVKPPADPRWLGPDICPGLLAWGKPPRSGPPCPQQRSASEPAGATRPTHRCLSRDAWLHRTQEPSTQKPGQCRRARTAGSGCL